MAVKSQIKPSPLARKLFGVMVSRSDRLHLPLDKTLKLAVERTKSGLTDETELRELQEEEWISQSADGGWLLAGDEMC